MAKQLFKVIYKPEGGSRREWTIDMMNPPWDITFATEKATDWPWAVFRERLGRESAVAFQALLWVLRKRDEPRLALDSVRPDMGEIDIAATCPQCEAWISDEDEDEHECPVPEPEAAGEGAVEDDPEA